MKKNWRRERRDMRREKIDVKVSSRRENEEKKQNDAESGIHIMD